MSFEAKSKNGNTLRVQFKEGIIEDRRTLIQIEGSYIRETIGVFITEEKRKELIEFLQKDNPNESH